MTTEGIESLSAELEALKAVYLDDLELVDLLKNVDSNEESSTNGKSIRVKLLPQTADKKSEQFVAMTLCCEIPEKYPTEAPKVNIQSPRGLNDAKVKAMTDEVNKLAEKNVDNMMLYDIISRAQELLTKYNFPGEPCPICLYGFVSQDNVVVTQCFHHYHARCLVEYIQSQLEIIQKLKTEKEELNAARADLKSGGDEVAKANDETKQLIPCALCKTDVDLMGLVDLATDEKYPVPFLQSQSQEGEAKILEQAKLDQEKLAALFKKQQSQGGIIDEEKEKERYLIRISNESNEAGDKKPIEVGIGDTLAMKTSSTNAAESSPVKDAKNESYESGISVSKPPSSAAENKTEKETAPKAETKTKSRRKKYRPRTKSAPQVDVTPHEEDFEAHNQRRRGPPRAVHRVHMVPHPREMPHFYGPPGLPPRGRGMMRGRRGGFYRPPNVAYVCQPYNASNEFAAVETNSVNRDRPGYYAARVFRPPMDNSAEEGETKDEVKGAESSTQEESVKRGGRKSRKKAQHGGQAGAQYEGADSCDDVYYMQHNGYGYPPRGRGGYRYDYNYGGYGCCDCYGRQYYDSYDYHGYQGTRGHRNGPRSSSYRNRRPQQDMVAKEEKSRGRNAQSEAVAEATGAPEQRSASPRIVV